MNDALPAQIRQMSGTAAFNRWCGFEVTDCDVGRVVLEMPWRAEAGQYAGDLHAGLVGALSRRCRVAS